MEKTSIERLQNIADGLTDLNEQVVFVGGAACGLYATDTAAQDARPTMDVDCVVELFSYHEYTSFEDKLRQRRFINDIEPGAPVCRWIYKGDYIATKLDAILSRGGSDLRISHDFEDVIYVLNYCPEFQQRYLHEEESLRTFIHEQFVMLQNRPNIHEEIECALPLGEEDRVDLILGILSL